MTQLRDDIYLINVVARATADQRLSLDTLRGLQVPVPGGRTVALGTFASFEYEQEYPLIWRRDRVPTLTVRADVVPGVLPEAVVARLEPGIAALIAATLPKGYRDRARRHRRGERRLARLGPRGRADDAGHHVHRADGPAAELPSGSAW